MRDIGQSTRIARKRESSGGASALARLAVEVAGTTRKPSILVLEGIGDTYTKNNTTRSLAWLLGPIPQLAPPPRRLLPKRRGGRHSGGGLVGAFPPPARLALAHGGAKEIPPGWGKNAPRDARKGVE
jgi:hypothetical protein